MAEAIVFKLPTGHQITLDMDRVMTIPSEGGELSFTDRTGSRKLGPYRVGKTHIQYIVDDFEVVEALTTIPLEAINGNDEGN